MATRMSVATIDAPEFINISSINPLISKCEIKVLYIGENRNRSYISKEVATEMAATLPGTPIVGYYIEKKEDFGDHGQQVIIDGEGVKFKTLTTPYGFVAPDAKIWFKKFEDTDDFGNTVVREYLMTEGYLWTGQFEECQRVLDGGNPHSMELDEKTLKGHWSEDVNRGVEFFIINDAIFSKLCILGEDVEPCFEGSSVTAPDISTTFSKDDGFNRTLYTMMQELNNALKGETKMENENIVVAEETPVAETEFSENSQDNVVEENIAEIEETIEEVESAIVEESPISETESEVAAEFTATETEEVATETEAETVDEVAEVESVPAEEAGNTEAPADEFARKNDEKEESEDKEESAEEETKEEEASDEEDEKKKKYALLEEKYADLEAKYAALDAEYQKLVAFKNEIDSQKKDDLIASFSMLTEADKEEVIANKANYSLEDIESKLSILFTRKQMSAPKEVVEEEEAPLIYASETDLYTNSPDWVKAVLDTQNTL